MNKGKRVIVIIVACVLCGAFVYGHIALRIDNVYEELYVRLTQPRWLKRVNTSLDLDYVERSSWLHAEDGLREYGIIVQWAIQNVDDNRKESVTIVECRTGDILELYTEEFNPKVLSYASCEYTYNRRTKTLQCVMRVSRRKAREDDRLTEEERAEAEEIRGRIEAFIEAYIVHNQGKTRFTTDNLGRFKTEETWEVYK